MQMIIVLIKCMVANTNEIDAQLLKGHHPAICLVCLNILYLLYTSCMQYLLYTSCMQHLTSRLSELKMFADAVVCIFFA